MKKNIVFLSLVVCLCSCTREPYIKTTSMNEFIDIHQEHQALYLEDSNPSNIGKYSAYAELENYANPKPVTLKWRDNVVKKEYTLKVWSNVSEDTDEIEDSWTFKVNERIFYLYNCKVNKIYHFSVENEDVTSLKNSFTIKSTSLRNIYVDGVDNFRDLGGYTTNSGKEIKQGLVYRSAEFNKNKQSSLVNLVSADGLATLNEQLGIKTDVDLRKNVESDGVIENSGITSSPIGDKIKYISAPMSYDGENMLEHSDETKKSMNLDAIAYFFNALSDADNLPLVYHCVQGKDRTGLLSYLLLGLLDAKEEDIYRDYLFTNFSRSVGSACKLTDIQNRYGLTISKMDGDSLSQKVKNYLISIGLSEETLNKVISNLVK